MEKWSQDWVINYSFPLAPPRFLFAQIVDFTQQFLLDVPFHLNAIKIFHRLHDVTTSRGE